MAEADQHILISGAGIAGMTAALCLAQAGFTISVFEKSTNLEDTGAGIQISPNAFDVFQSLGLSKLLTSMSAAPEGVRMIDAISGERIVDVPMGTSMTKRYKKPYLVIHRGDLQSILLSRCIEEPAIKLHLGSEVMDVASHANGVTLLTRNGKLMRETPASIAIAADGIWSRIRTQSLNLPAPIDTGKIAIRALIPTAEISNKESLIHTHLWLAPGAHGVTYAVRGGRLLNVIVICDADKTPAQEADLENILAERTSHWHRSFKDIVGHVSAWGVWPVFETQKIDAMVKENVVLIGDAAHAMRPFAAQGAAMGIEDAGVLARLLSSNEDTSLALRKFETERISRIRKVTKFARTNGNIYHLPKPLSLARNLVMRLTPPARLLSRQDWIYKWQLDG